MRLASWTRLMPSVRAAMRIGSFCLRLSERNGVTYLLLITRENPNANGPLRDGVTIGVAFSGNRNGPRAVTARGPSLTSN
jgi:hypothetical protein